MNDPHDRLLAARGCMYGLLLSACLWAFLAACAAQALEAIR